MRFKSFLSICAISLLSGCAAPIPDFTDAPEFPKGPACTLIWKESLEESYLFCVDTATTKTTRVPAEDAFKGKYMAGDPAYVAKVMAWQGDMAVYVKKHCGGSSQ